jgi:hypothetical protein
MRYLLVAMIVCAAATPASALPAVGSNGPSVMKAAPIVQVAKRSRPSAVRHRHSLGGIHPLVGSGDY